MLYGLFALHLAGALKHHFIDRDGDMARIAPGMRTGSWSDPRLLVIGAAAIVAAVFGLTWRPGPSDRVTVAPPPAAAPELPAIPTPDASPVPTPSASAPAPEAAATAEAEQGVSSWAILPGSSLRFRTTWSGEAITGGFTKFGGDIAFGPDQLDKSAVTITIDTGSVFSGDSERDGTLEGDDWFAVGANRNAVFKATRFSKTGGDRYVASGTLRMKGVTAPISVPFTLRIVDEQATMQGSATIDRLAYKIGEGEFASTAEIPAVVAVQITIKARRIQP